MDIEIFLGILYHYSKIRLITDEDQAPKHFKYHCELESDFWDDIDAREKFISIIARNAETIQDGYNPYLEIINYDPITFFLGTEE